MKLLAKLYVILIQAAILGLVILGIVAGLREDYSQGTYFLVLALLAQHSLNEE